MRLHCCDGPVIDHWPSDTVKEEGAWIGVCATPERSSDAIEAKKQKKKKNIFKNFFLRRINPRTTHSKTTTTTIFKSFLTIFSLLFSYCLICILSLRSWNGANHLTLKIKETDENNFRVSSLHFLLIYLQRNQITKKIEKEEKKKKWTRTSISCNVIHPEGLIINNV